MFNDTKHRAVSLRQLNFDIVLYGDSGTEHYLCDMLLLAVT